MKFNLKKIVTSLLMLSILGVFETSKVDAAEVNTSRSECKPIHSFKNLDYFGSL